MSRRALIVLPALAITAAAVIAATGVLGRRDPAPASVVPAGPPATATVERRTLIRAETVGGTLGYGDRDPVQAAPGGRGMVTWLPEEGTVIGRGDTVYRVDQQRVPLLYGSIPLYRTLSAGSGGDDVRQLERNLSGLGFAGFTVDAHYTPATAHAVARWQAVLGRKKTGVVRPGDAVVAPGERRVAELSCTPGAPASGVLLTWTGTTRVVTADLDSDYADLVAPGAAATVELPDGAEVPARVAHVGTPTSNAKGDGATVPLELSVTDQRKLGRYQLAEVGVGLAAETREDVLAVPVNALVARPGGGYAVTAVDDSGRHQVAVRTGMFADGYVEVSGVAAGLTVGVPR